MGLKKSLWTNGTRGVLDQMDCEQGVEGLIAFYQVKGKNCASRRDM